MTQGDLTTGRVKELTQQIMGAGVTQITAPGGKDRQSLRLHLDDDRTVIVTRRTNAIRSEHEASFLSALNALGAKVPKLYGFAEGLMFQQDAGRERLSYRLMRADLPEKRALAEAAIKSLQTLREQVESNLGLMAKLPALGASDAWREDFVSRPVFLSHSLGIPKPDVDLEDLGARLKASPDRFTRWDARCGNAAVQPDGTILWYDWEVFGRRGGFEDLAWLVADDFWPFDAETSSQMLQTHAGLGPERLRGLGVFVVLILANRLRLLMGRLDADGWATPDTVLRNDRLGATPEILRRIAVHAQGWAARDETLAPFGPWFKAASDALIARGDA